MSGGGVIGGQAPRFAMLEKIAALDTSAADIRLGGKDWKTPVRGDVGMLASAGLTRLFGRAVPSEDRANNQATLRWMLDSVEEEARRVGEASGMTWSQAMSFASEVRDKVAATGIRLEGEAEAVPLVVRQMHGTYVSSDLARALIEVAKDAIATQKEVVADEAANGPRPTLKNNFNMVRGTLFGKSNENQLDLFLGREARNPDTAKHLREMGSHLADASGARRPGPSGAEALIADIAARGAPGHPPGDKAFWSAFRQHWQEALNDPESPGARSLRQFERELKGPIDQMAMRGTLLREDVLADRLRGLMTNPQRLAEVQERSRAARTESLGVQQFEAALQDWRSGQPPELQERITEADCTRLARALHQAQRPPDHNADPPGLREALGEPPGPDVELDRTARDLVATLRRNAAKEQPPPGADIGQRRQFYAKLHPGKPELVQRLLLQPPDITPKDIARWLGAGLEGAFGPRPPERMPAERLADNLAPHPGLGARAKHFAPEVVDAAPGTVRELLAAVLLEPLARHQVKDQVERFEAATQPTKLEEPPPETAPQEVRDAAAAYRKRLAEIREQERPDAPQGKPGLLDRLRGKQPQKEEWIELQPIRPQGRPPGLTPPEDGDPPELHRLWDAYALAHGRWEEAAQREVTAKETSLLEGARGNFAKQFGVFSVIDDHAGFARGLAALGDGLRELRPDQLARLDRRAEALRERADAMESYAKALEEGFHEADYAVPLLARDLIRAAEEIRAGLDDYAFRTADLSRIGPQGMPPQEDPGELPTLAKVKVPKREDEGWTDRERLLGRRDADALRSERLEEERRRPGPSPSGNGLLVQTLPLEEEDLR